MLKGFRDFLLRGNIVDLAVAVVLGTAFGAVVKAFADDFVGGLIGVLGGTPDFGNSGISIGDGKIVYGTTITALIYFVIVAAVIYFVVVLPLQSIIARRKKAEAVVDAQPSEEAQLLAEIRDLLRAEQQR